MLTENGITRWLAHHATTEMTSVASQEIGVRALLRKDENRTNCDFVPSKATVEKTMSRFVLDPILEAVIITSSGQKDEKPIGIVTRWDAVREV